MIIHRSSRVAGRRVPGRLFMPVKRPHLAIDKIRRSSYITTIVISDGRTMKLTRKLNFLLLGVFGSLSAAFSVAAQSCAPPAGFIDVPHPALAATELLVSHTEEITVDQPLAVVLD